MNVNFGLFPPLAGLPKRTPKRERNERLAERALADLEPWLRAVRAPDDRAHGPETVRAPDDGGRSDPPSGRDGTTPR